MKIFYHNDMDGILSARAIIEMLKLEGKTAEKENVIAMDYTKDFPLGSIEKNEEIYIVDYSISPEQMYDLLIETSNVVWIDHHKSAIEKYENFVTPIENSKPGWKIPGIRYSGIAGCVLTFWYLFGIGNETEKFLEDYPNNVDSDYRRYIPLVYRLAGDWDVWEHLYGQITKNFATYFGVKIEDPFNEELNKIINDNEKLDRALTAGKRMIEFRDGWAKKFMESYGFEMKIDQHIAFMANMGNANSEYFGNLVNKYDIVGTFCFNGEKWNCSLYSTKDYIDCAEICVRYGGGGHKGAAGFTSYEIPLEMFKK